MDFLKGIRSQMSLVESQIFCPGWYWTGVDLCVCRPGSFATDLSCEVGCELHSKPSRFPWASDPQLECAMVPLTRETGEVGSRICTEMESSPWLPVKVSSLHTRWRPTEENISGSIEDLYLIQDHSFGILPGRVSQAFSMQMVILSWVSVCILWKNSQPPPSKRYLQIWVRKIIGIWLYQIFMLWYLLKLLSRYMVFSQYRNKMQKKVCNTITGLVTFFFKQKELSKYNKEKHKNCIK